jgi:dephospho-CoA kinase
MSADRAPGPSVRIGLTGPIGCGKSTIAGWLEELGATVIDADVVAREVTAPGEPALDAVLERFGEGYRAADGELDRAALGRHVFGDPDELRDLEAIVHPAVRRRIESALATGEASGVEATVIEAIKLVEGGLAALCDEVWLVTCGSSAQRERLARRGGDPAEAAQRIAAQGAISDRLRPAATRIIDTSGDRDATRRIVVEAWHGLGLDGA